MTPRRSLDGVRHVCFYVFMRTTIEFSPELIREAKARAAAQGESLKALLTRAVASELGKSRNRETGIHVRLPLFGNPKGKPVQIRNEDIGRVLAEDDARQSRIQKRSRKK